MSIVAFYIYKKSPLAGDFFMHFFKIYFNALISLPFFVAVLMHLAQTLTFSPLMFLV